MLEDYNRSLSAIGDAVLLARNAVDGVDVVVRRRIEVLFKWIAELLGHEAGWRCITHLVLDCLEETFDH